MAEMETTSMEDVMKTSRMDGARGAVMVVVTLIATMVYQSAMSPPGGVWPENSYTAKAGSFNCTANTTCIAGTAVLAYSDTKSYIHFVGSNTFILCLCLIIMIGLVCFYTLDLSDGFQVLGLSVSLLIVFVAFTYLKAVQMLSPKFVLEDHDMHNTIKWYKVVMGSVAALICCIIAIVALVDACKKKEERD